MRILNCHTGWRAGALVIAMLGVVSRSAAQTPLSGQLFDQRFETPLNAYWVEWSTADSVAARGCARSDAEGRFEFDAGVPGDLPIDLVVLDRERRPVAWAPEIRTGGSTTVLAIAVPAATAAATSTPAPAAAGAEVPRKKSRFRRWLASPGGSTVLVVTLAAVVALGADRLTDDPPRIADNPSPSSP